MVRRVEGVRTATESTVPPLSQMRHSRARSAAWSGTLPWSVVMFCCSFGVISPKRSRISRDQPVGQASAQFYVEGHGERLTRSGLE